MDEQLEKLRLLLVDVQAKALSGLSRQQEIALLKTVMGRMQDILGTKEALKQVYWACKDIRDYIDDSVIDEIDKLDEELDVLD